MNIFTQFNSLYIYTFILFCFQNVIDIIPNVKHVRKVKMLFIILCSNIFLMNSTKVMENKVDFEVFYLIIQSEDLKSFRI